MYKTYDKFLALMDAIAYDYYHGNVISATIGFDTLVDLGRQCVAAGINETVVQMHITETYSILWG